MKKILITGSSGYIGSHLCRSLKGKYEIHGLDLIDPKVPIDKFFRVDINQLHHIPGQIYLYDAVVHLAALVNVSESEIIPTQYYVTNLNGALNILNTIPTKNFIFASTGAAALCENAYGISKRAAEDCIVEHCEKFYPKDYTIFRFYNVIGSEYGIQPTNPDGLMYNLIKASNSGKFSIFGNDYDTPDGTCIRDYVHVMEICHAIEQAIEAPANQLENLGHGVGKSVLEIASKFQEVNSCNFEIEYRERRRGDAAISVLSNPSTYLKQLYTLEELLKIKEPS